jgi:hypothetical protein
MDFLSQLEYYLFRDFEFYKEKKRREWDELYKGSASGYEIVHKWNVTPSMIYERK